MPAAAKTPAPVVQAIAELVAPATLADEFAALSAARAAFAETERKYQKLRSVLVELVEDGDPEAQYLVRGTRFDVLISACGFERKPDVPAVRKILGAEAFLKCCSVSLKALGDWLTAKEIDAVVVTVQSGGRKYEPVAK